MTTAQKMFAALVVTLAIGGAYFFPQALVQQQNSGSPAGSTFGTAKVAQINITPITGATSTGILNTDASDRYVIDNFVACSGATTTYTAFTGAGLANWIAKAATSSTLAPAVNANTNFVMNDIVATGTAAAGAAGFPIVLIASSSVPTTSPIQNNVGVGAYQFVWAAGSYMNFYFNATSTAACTVGVHYLAS